MKRLTKRDEFGNADIIALENAEPSLYGNLSFEVANILTATLNRLADYEDTELSVIEILQMKENPLNHIHIGDLVCEIGKDTLGEWHFFESKIQSINISAQKIAVTAKPTFNLLDGNELLKNTSDFEKLENGSVLVNTPFLLNNVTKSKIEHWKTQEKK